MTPSFRALRFYQRDGHVENRWEDLPSSELDNGDVLIRVRFSGINYKDALAATGVGKIIKRSPLIGGIDAAGVVLESQHPNVTAGEQVLITGCGLGETHDGGYAELLRVPHEWVVPLPEGIDSWTAMCLGTAGFTAALAIQRMEYSGQTPDKGPMVVTGATGGVGSFAINMLSGLGYEVVAITSKRAQIPYLKQLGASEILLRKELDLGTKPLESARWAGAIDNVGGELLSWLTRSTGWWGNIAAIGMAAGHELHTSVMPFILRGVSLLGINSMAISRPERLAVWKRISTDLKPSQLTQIGHRTIPFADLQPHFQEFIDGGVVGRTVVKISES